MKVKVFPLKRSELKKNLVFHVVPFALTNDCMIKYTSDITSVISIFISPVVTPGSIQNEIMWVLCFELHG